jgi:hypothetical protein
VLVSQTHVKQVALVCFKLSISGGCQYKNLSSKLTQPRTGLGYCRWLRSYSTVIVFLIILGFEEQRTIKHSSLILALTCAGEANRRRGLCVHVPCIYHCSSDLELHALCLCCFLSESEPQASGFNLIEFVQSQPIWPSIWPNDFRVYAGSAESHSHLAVPITTMSLVIYYSVFPHWQR